MSKINILDKQVAELIAAGEVVERPASVIKELVENSIDAGSTSVTVEIKNGGVLYLRVTDNGCGIAKEDVKKAFLRHATSKIKEQDDLEKILTLGFRGEALAAISSVSKVTMLTKSADDICGTNYCIEGGCETSFEEIGAVNGTTIIVEDIFYNTPARMKFLKKDVSEGNAVSAIMDRIALSHPEVAFKFIRDSKIAMQTSGDGKLSSAIYSVCGRDFSNGLIKMDGNLGGIKVSGFVSKPIACKPNRNGQFVFLNGRFVKSGTVAAALEQAYKNSAMTGKFPTAVIHLTVPANAVDVNVHPAKTEVRFSDEKRIFDCVYYGVKSALNERDQRPSMEIKPKPQIHMDVRQYKQTEMDLVQSENRGDKKADIFHELITATRTNKSGYITMNNAEIKTNNVAEKVYHNAGYDVVFEADSIESDKPHFMKPAAEQEPVADKPKVIAESAVTTKPESEPKAEPIVYIGEAFKTYIIASMGEDIYLIDKHAAHERILYEKLVSENSPGAQLLLTPKSVVMARDEFETIMDSLCELENAGFEIEDFGNGSLLVRAVPAMLTEENISELLSELAENLAIKHSIQNERTEAIFHTMACRAAIKAGNKSQDAELAMLAQRVLSNRDIMYCPHGRPVAMKITKKEIEKQFGRMG